MDNGRKELLRSQRDYWGNYPLTKIQYDAFSNLFSTEMENRKRKLTYL